MDFPILDIILVIPLLLGVWKGIKKGFVLEVATLAGLILGVYAGYEFSDVVQQSLQANFNIDYPLIAFAVTFLGVLIAVYFLGKIIEKLVNIVALGWLNKIAGVVFSVFKYGFVLSVLILIVNKIDAYYSFFPPAMKEESFLYEPVEQLAPMILPMLNDLSIPSMELPNEMKSVQDTLPTTI